MLQAEFAWHAMYQRAQAPKSLTRPDASESPHPAAGSLLLNSQMTALSAPFSPSMWPAMSLVSSMLPMELKIWVPMIGLAGDDLGGLCETRASRVPTSTKLSKICRVSRS